MHYWVVAGSSKFYFSVIHLVVSQASFGISALQENKLLSHEMCLESLWTPLCAQKVLHISTVL